jgi:hypothetical protein
MSPRQVASALSVNLQPTIIPEHTEIFTYNAQQVLARLGLGKYIEEHARGISTKFTDDTNKKVATQTIAANTNRAFEAIKTQVELLQSIVNNPATLARKIVAKQQVSEQDVNDEAITLGSEIISINRQGNQAVISFNYGRLLQHLQNQPELNTSAPVIAANPASNDSFTISRNNLLRYLEELNPSGLVFEEVANANDANNPLFRPYAYSSANNQRIPAIHQPTIFDIIVDRSGSMDTTDAQGSTRLAAAQQQISYILDQIDGNTNHNWVANITFFDDKRETRTFHGNAIAAKQFINKFGTGNTTALNPTLNDTLSQVQDNQTRVIMLLTDGENTDHSVSDEELATNARNKSLANPRSLMLYSFGIGDGYIKSFFDNLSNVGFEHIHLNNPQELPDKFFHRIGNIANTRQFFEFITNELSQYFRNAAGDVSIFPHPLPQNVVIKIDGKEYHIQDKRRVVAVDPFELDEKSAVVIEDVTEEELNPVNPETSLVVYDAKFAHEAQNPASFVARVASNIPAPPTNFSARVNSWVGSSDASNTSSADNSLPRLQQLEASRAAANVNSRA